MTSDGARFWTPFENTAGPTLIQGWPESKVQKLFLSVPLGSGSRNGAIHPDFEPFWWVWRVKCAIFDHFGVFLIKCVKIGHFRPVSQKRCVFGIKFDTKTRKNRHFGTKTEEKIPNLLYFPGAPYQCVDHPFLKWTPQIVHVKGVDFDPKGVDF